MRTTTRLGWACLVALATVALAEATAQVQTASSMASPSIVGSHQVDRFEAIRQLQVGLRERPDNETDLIILGELAQEVALDLPAGQAGAYFQMARDAFQSALRLDPNNESLKVAVQFATDQEAGAGRFNQMRKDGAATYINARRSELILSKNTPTIEMFNLPAEVSQDIPANAEPATVPTTVKTYPPQYFTQPVYQPYVVTPGKPLTYDRYTSAYTIPAVPAAPNAPANAPMTIRQYSQQLRSASPAGLPR